MGYLGKCLLVLKDMGDCRPYIYGFITTGDPWRKLRCDVSGGLFVVTIKVA